jgi:predicted nuclease with TOPRIM domain
MQQKLIDKIEELSKECQQLITKREQHYTAIKEIETRLHQIAGAITALDSLIKENKGETGTNS